MKTIDYVKQYCSYRYSQVFAYETRLWYGILILSGTAEMENQMLDVLRD